ncbi:nucleotidyltransferase domain-containing protein [Pseudolysinimonas sp.]
MFELEVALRFVEAHFAHASLAVVGGSTAAGTRTQSSDIDILIIGPATMFAENIDSLAAYIEHEGFGFEVFAYVPNAFEAWSAQGLADYVPVLQDLLLNGIVVRGEAQAAELRDHWRPIIERGPHVEQHAIDLRRYMATDLLDDLIDATDAFERRLLADALFSSLAEIMLLANGQWLGRGKWLSRRLFAWEFSRADALAEPLVASDYAGFIVAAEAELSRLGGRVKAGFIR